MMPRLAILCPGQGGQHAAMFDLARSDPAIALALEQWLAAAGLDRPLQEILSQDNLLFSNLLAQPLIVAATVATWSVLQPLLPIPELVAGYSIGELAAWHVAGAISASQVIGLAASRAQLMDACLQPESPQVLFAVSGIALRQLAVLLASQRLYVAIETDADSCIVGGLQQDMLTVAGEIRRLGGKITVLPVTVASHTPLMATAAEPFFEQLRQQFRDNPVLPVLSGVDGHVLTKKEQAITALSQQMTHTIRWHACMDACAERGVTAALELGPGAALSRMLAARHPHIACRSVSEFRSLQGVAGWLQRL
ncbi:Malonyl CoA acyl carrier protein transacylase [Collimonas arenae]|uniref:Malonyl CoA acyl carrier protein transacylase n=1 Tax=Collimonas arenae TaxID=279058 RepID=A0A0A1FH11_9BURK|nr:acyltransferase domain-containing protein [Collimonas arenae]AIY42172.1 Malonyl CoA acyl carrier protein transacylase [Collimonas arenae]